MNKIPFKTASHKVELICIVVLEWHFKVKLGKKQKYFESFHVWNYSLKSKGRNKTFEWLLLFSTWWVQSFSGVKVICKVERKQLKVDLKNGWYMWRSCHWSWISQHFLFHIKILTYIHRLLSVDLDTWKFIIGLWYNPKSMC